MDSRLRGNDGGAGMIKEMIREKSFYQGVASTEVPQMNHLYQTLFSRGGKALRAAMTCQVASCLNIPTEKSNKLGRIVEYIHQSSILHDDVIDASPTRRGALSTWMQYSMKRAVLAGDYLLAQAASETAEMENIALMKITSDVLKKLVKGEWIQDAIRNKESMSELKKVHELKTASLFQWSLRAPFLVVHRNEDKLHECLNRIGLMMGLLFQSADDLLDFDIRNRESKAVFKDMTEGCFNSFAVHLSKNKNNRFKSVLKSCRCLKEVKNLTGEEEFEKTLSSFDEINKKIIEDCHQEIKKLEGELLKKEHSLVHELQKWPVRFYWRQSV